MCLRLYRVWMGINVSSIVSFVYICIYLTLKSMSSKWGLSTVKVGAISREVRA